MNEWVHVLTHPAMQVQCAATISPVFLVATQERITHAWINKSFQNYTLARVIQIPNFNGSHKPACKEIIGIQLLPLKQLLACINARAINKIAEDVPKLNWGPEWHVAYKVLGIYCRIRVVIHWKSQQA